VLADAVRAPLGWPARFSERARHHWRRLRRHARRKRDDYKARREQRRRAKERAGLRLDPELARQLLATVEEPSVFPGVAGMRTTVFDKQRCPHCLGLHSRKCPAVEEIEYHGDGRVQRVKYWPEWDESAVLWREDLEEAAAWRDEFEGANVAA
jgi:hypothetical protein